MYAYSLGLQLDHASHVCHYSINVGRLTRAIKSLAQRLNERGAVLRAVGNVAFVGAVALKDFIGGSVGLGGIRHKSAQLIGALAGLDEEHLGFVLQRPVAQDREDHVIVQ